MPTLGVQIRDFKHKLANFRKIFVKFPEDKLSRQRGDYDVTGQEYQQKTDNTEYTT